MSAKKAAARPPRSEVGRPPRGAIPARASAPAKAQPPAERREAEAEAVALIARFTPTCTNRVAAIRRHLRKRLPTAHEIVYEYRSWFVISYAPTLRGQDGLLAIRGDADGIKLYFNLGKSLPDPEKHLQGSGPGVRWLPLSAAATLKDPAVARLIDESIARTPIPFPPAGRGSITLSQSTQTRRKK